MPTSVQVPVTLEQLNQVRSLMRSFIAWHKDRHREDMHLIDAYFDAEAFEQELASLPGKYAPPHGQLLLATVDGMRHFQGGAPNSSLNTDVPRRRLQRRLRAAG